MSGFATRADAEEYIDARPVSVLRTYASTRKDGRGAEYTAKCACGGQH